RHPNHPPVRRANERGRPSAHARLGMRLDRERLRHYIERQAVRAARLTHLGLLPSVTYPERGSGTGTISTSPWSIAKSSRSRVYSGSPAASAVAAISMSKARRPRALRPPAAMALYTRP